MEASTVMAEGVGYQRANAQEGKHSNLNFLNSDISPDDYLALLCVALKVIKIELLRRSLSVCGTVDCIILMRQEQNSLMLCSSHYLGDCKLLWRRLWLLSLESFGAGGNGMDLQL